VADTATTTRPATPGPLDPDLDRVSEPDTSLTCRTPGEAFDSGDKSTAKAMSVAYRTALLQALTLPTDEPDPDETVEELAPRQQNGNGPAQQADPWRTELTAAERRMLKTLLGVTDANRLRAAWKEAERAQMEMPELRVRPLADLTAEEAFVLEVEEPTPLKEVVGRIGTHLKEVGSSVRKAVEDGAAEMGGGYGG
jgi:hypothetical protein